MNRWMCLAMLFTVHAAFANPWAGHVVAYSPGANALYTDASAALGAPAGGGPSTPDNDSIVSLGGPGGSLTLAFDSPVTDDAGNPLGLDCVVFTNAFWNGGNPQVRWEEPAIIEIADAAEGPWYLIPGSRAFAYSPFPSLTEASGTSNSSSAPYYLAGSIRNPNLFDTDTSNDQMEYNWGYAKLNPTAVAYLDNYLRPDDPTVVGITTRSGGGDAFDIAWAVDTTGQPANLPQFRYIRLTSFITRNMGQLGVCSPDIDAVADVAPDTDTDGDGLLDEYETLVAGTDPARAENTVLPLEIPALEGGSSSGTLLGTAQDAAGDALRLYAGEERTAEGRALSTTVDIAPAADPGSELPSLSQVKSTCVREFTSSVADFVGAGIAPAECVMHYTAAEITGLSEGSLQPYRYVDGGYTTANVSEVSVNAAANRVTFRSRYAGLFVLVSGPGSGDADTQHGPQGVITLAADPAQGMAVGESNTATLASGIIYDETANPVADGTRFTVAASAGTIRDSDIDANVAGVQVAALGGSIQFSIQAPTASGSALITATSVEGAAYGELAYAFTAGAPVPTVRWTVGAPETGTDVHVTLRSSVIHDAYGNVVREGTPLTLVCVGGEIVSGDADLGASGAQVLTAGGRVSVIVSTPEMASLFSLAAYADSALTVPLGEDTYSPSDYVPMPFSPWVAPGTMAVIGALAAGMRRGRSRRKG